MFCGEAALEFVELQEETAGEGRTWDIANFEGVRGGHFEDNLRL